MDFVFLKMITLHDTRTIFTNSRTDETFGLVLQLMVYLGWIFFGAFVIVHVFLAILGWLRAFVLDFRHLS